MGKPQDLARLVRERMEALGVSAYRLEQLTDIPRQTIGTFTAGRTAITSDKLARLLSALDLVVQAKTKKE